MGDEMRAFQRLTALTAAVASAGLLVAGVGGVASASTRTAPTVRLTGGLTTVTTSPGIAAALVSNGIVPLATTPGQQSLILKPGLAVRLTFPVTGGRVSLHPVGGFVTHIGGILFLDTKTGKEVEVSNFTIDITRDNLNGIVNGNPKARIAIFKLGLGHAVIKAGWHSVSASNIKLSLTPGAASALDASLGTTVFTAGLGVGTAGTVLHF
jgi:hypothetical protein